MDVAIYPGSFDPITLGHLNILERALDIFSEVTLLVAINPNKQPLFSLEESMQMISEAIRELPRANVDFHDGLTVEYARQRGIRTAVRGLRAVTDFENEFAMALTNRSLWPEFDTVFLMTKAEYMYLSSSVVRQVSEMGGDVGQFVPPCVERHLQEKFGHA
jgi:pantetheine-phosphate adenylyltransferase